MSSWFPLDAFFQHGAEPFVNAQGWARTNPMPDIEQPVRDLQLPPERPAWRERVRNALQSLGGEAALQTIYRAIEKQFPEALARKHWKAKIRQVVQMDPQIERVENGVWGLVAPDNASDASKSE